MRERPTVERDDRLGRFVVRDPAGRILTVTLTEARARVFADNHARARTLWRAWGKGPC